MGTLTVTIARRQDVTRRARAAFAGKAQGARVSFPDAGLLWKVLGPKRLALLKEMAGQGPMTTRALARRAGRDVKAVHGDVQALLAAGLLDRAEGRKIVFPYDAVHVDFLLEVV